MHRYEAKFKGSGAVRPAAVCLKDHAKAIIYPASAAAEARVAPAGRSAAGSAGELGGSGRDGSSGDAPKYLFSPVCQAATKKKKGEGGTTAVGDMFPQLPSFIRSGLAGVASFETVNAQLYVWRAHSSP